MSMPERQRVDQPVEPRRGSRLRKPSQKAIESQLQALKQARSVPLRRKVKSWLTGLPEDVGQVEDGDGQVKEEEKGKIRRKRMERGMRKLMWTRRIVVPLFLVIGRWHLVGLKPVLHQWLSIGRRLKPLNLRLKLQLSKGKWKLRRRSLDWLKLQMRNHFVSVR
jgi:hypothetical protein